MVSLSLFTAAGEKKVTYRLEKRESWVYSTLRQTNQQTEMSQQQLPSMPRSPLYVIDFLV